MSGVMQVRCAWCDTDLGFKPCCSEMHGKVSHGICRPCMARQIARDLTPDSFAAFPTGAAPRSFDVGGRVAPAHRAAAESTPRDRAADVEFVSCVRLAEVCGVSSHFLESQIRPEEWAVPREMRWDGRAMCYARARLPELVTALERRGLYDAAIKLDTWCRGDVGAREAPWYQRGAMA